MLKNILFNRRMLIVFLQGFSSGLPLLLTGSTLQAYMKESGVDLTTIGLFSLVGLPYSFKFLWSPIMDSMTPPFLGLRKGWLLITQLLLIIPIFMIGTVDPLTNPWMIALFAFLVAFFSASQDIVIDAYRREVFYGDEKALGMASSYYVLAYRLALLFAGGGALFLADHFPWPTVFKILSGGMIIGILATFFAPEVEQIHKKKLKLREAIIEPLVDYFQRKGAFEILLFILLYKIGDTMAGAITTPFFLDLGFTKTELAVVVKSLGIWFTIAGGIIGGICILKLGIEKSLWYFGILQMLSTFVFSILALTGKNMWVLSFTILFENLTSGMGTSAYSAFMASLTNIRFTATQYALLTSLMALPRVLFGASSGFLAEQMGWAFYFAMCGLIAIPGLLFILRFKHWENAN
jgi:PAT family beta-lactamase induction signal transducer AmpG